MRILFLDDNEERHVGYRRDNIGHSIDHVFTARAAIEKLTYQPPYDLVSLDHDLDLQAQAGNEPLEETGQVVADFIAKELPVDKRPGQIKIHSYNFVGASRMAATLRDAGIPSEQDPFRRTSRRAPP